MIMMQSIITVVMQLASFSCGTKQLAGIPTEGRAVLLYVTDFFPYVV